MGYTSQELLTRLQALGIQFQIYEHPVVMTVEEHAKYVGDIEGGHSKNLFLKDKKDRLYLVSALTSTKIDLKNLSQRLGLGKNGLRMAPNETLKEVLQVPLGCVTPFALFNESARSVALLLDQGFRRHTTCFFHPLSNDMTIGLLTKDLDKFLLSVGNGEPAYVDLEAMVSVGKDQQGDLAVYVPIQKKEDNIESNVPFANKNNISLQEAEVGHLQQFQNVLLEENISNKHKGKSVIDEKMKQPSSQARTVASVGEFVNGILDKASTILISNITPETITQHGNELGAFLAEGLRKHLADDLESLAMMFKNKSYTEGFIAGRTSAEMGLSRGPFRCL